MAEDMTVRQFVHSYLEAEYDLWVLAHTERQDERFFQAAETFDRTYFGPDVFSDVSRPGGMDDEQFRSFRDLLDAKQKRQLLSLHQEGDVALATLNSIDAGSNGPFELIRIRALDGQFRIVSSYLTNFDGTFSWSGGEDVGAVLTEPGAG